MHFVIHKSPEPAHFNASLALFFRLPCWPGWCCWRAGGDFADGVIAFEGDLLGGTEFVSFDQQAIKLLKAQKLKVRLLGP